MNTFYQYHCNKCKRIIGDKTHDWCQRKNIEDCCHDHIPKEVMIEMMHNRYKNKQDLLTNEQV